MRRRATLICVALLLAFAGLSWSAVSTKSPTMDEPVHLLSGWLALTQGDYRLEVANPALWKMWAAAGDLGVPLTIYRTGPVWERVAWLPRAELPWVRTTLFDTPGNDGAAFVRRGRAMMLVVGVALGVLVAGWAGRLGGPVAAVVAVGLFAFDPTFLAHAPLVKGDVAASLALLAVGAATWRFGRRATVGGAVGLGLLCGVAVDVKLTGLLAGPIIATLLLSRTMMADPWSTFGRVAVDLRQRLVVAVATGCVALGVVVAFTWGCYRFRYQPAADPSVAIDMAAVSAQAGSGLFATAVRLANAHHLLPQAFAAGALNQSANVSSWPAYLDGQTYVGGRMAYYPLAIAYKTPLPELAAFTAAVAVGVIAALTRAWRRPGAAWAVACVGVPAGAFAAASLLTPLNAGLRNVLPLYAYADVAAGCAAAWAWQRRPRVTATVVSVLLVGHGITAASAWPDYLPYFNAVAGDGRSRLADANLDWGQDVPALVAWQRLHPDVPLYADLFTPVDPAFYGLRYMKLWGRTPAGRPDLHLPTGPAVVAVSVTHLQGMYVDHDQAPLLMDLARRRPRAVLHGTIYLFDWPLR